ncbi:carbohydrate esterase family 16 protein [Amylostereum chailletii]|nr:carbohydrate esterase family 16 protein [Amylostereum chailletii]
MLRFSALVSAAVLASSALAASVKSRQTNDGIHLAISPTCGQLGGAYTNVNAGIDLGSVKTIVSFGDSYTDGGKHDGSPLLPAVLIPPSPRAGGRVTNGPVWVEGVASDAGATLMDYAISGAVVNVSLWASAAGQHDFVEEMATFLGQSNVLDPDTTLYTVFFGINDFSDSHTDGNHLPEAAAEILEQIQILSSPPTNGRSFLVTDVYGRGTIAATGEAFKQQIFDGLGTLRKDTGLNVAFVNFEELWDGVLGPTPGFAAFGYASDGYCVELNATTTDGACDDPEHTFYWLHGHPSKETHRIMADFVEDALTNCRVA